MLFLLFFLFSTLTTSQKYVVLAPVNPTLCMLGKCPCFLCRMLTFFQIIFLKNYFRNNIRAPNGLDLDQDRRSVGPVLGLKCLQRL